MSGVPNTDPPGTPRGPEGTVCKRVGTAIRGPRLIPAAAALAIRHGRGALGGLLTVELIGAAAALVGAGMAARWRGRAVWVYGPAALVVWAVVAGQALG